jgi:hypothetical protein
MKFRRAFLFCSVSTFLLLASGFPSAFSVSYIPGVRVGDSASYSVYEHWDNNISNVREPRGIALAIGATNMSLRVTLVNGEFVDVVQTWIFNNGSDSRANLLQGSIVQGTGKIVGWVIASGLSVGDPIYSTTGAPTINRNSTAFYAGDLHSVNTYNTPYSDTYLHGQQVDVWDRDTGLTLEASFNATARTGNGYAHGVSDIKIWQLSAPRVPESVSPFLGLMPNQLYIISAIIVTIILATVFSILRRYRR